ncbi:MAG: hypothetical protein V1754_07825 [Pseudomonadota bacterium]
MNAGPVVSNVAPQYANFASKVRSKANVPSPRADDFKKSSLDKVSISETAHKMAANKASSDMPLGGGKNPLS